ncbi:GXWXG domain-containing protein [Kutzneria viridogrisea]|uniref:GXWXG domain-containing protein n=1 Tax=Kutzneria viridogrisea TaxID=47990 RepID=UPI00398D67C6
MWADLETVRAVSILGSWRGFALPTDLPVERVLNGNRWHGKRLVALTPSRAGVKPA